MASLAWLRDPALAAARISTPDLAQIKIARDPDEVLEIVDAARDRQRPAPAPGDP